MTLTKRYNINGKVQHVGYRNFVKETAIPLNLTGMANHADNGNVLVIAQGEAEHFPAFEKALRFGSVMAFVKSIDSEILERSAYYRSFQVEGQVLSTDLTQTLKHIREEANSGIYDTASIDATTQITS